MVVAQEFVGKIDKLEASYHRLEAMNTKLLEENRRLAQSSRKHSDDAVAGLDRTVQSAMRAVTSYVSLQAAIQAVTAATRDKEEMERKANETTLTIADAQIKALRNLGNVSSEERAKFVGDMKKLADDTKVGLQPLYLAASSGLSASGGNVQATMRAVGAAARIAPESPEELEAISGALLHMGKATGTQDAMQNLGFLLGVGQQAAVTETGKIASNLAPAVIGVTGYGGTASEAGAIVAALTQGMADPEGRKSGTAAIALAKQLEKAAGQGSPLANIRYMQTHPEERAAFVEAASFEGKAQIPVEQLLGVEGRGDVSRRFMDEALTKIPIGKEAAAVAEGMIAGIREPFEQQVAGGARSGATAREQLAMTPEGRLASLRGNFPLYGENGLLAYEQSGGTPWFTRQRNALQWMKTTSPIYETEQALITDVQLARNRAASGTGSQESVALLEKRLAEVRDAMKEEARLLKVIADRAGGPARAQEQLTVGGE